MRAAQDLFSGRVTVRASGVQPEKLINLASSKGIALRDVRRESTKVVLFSVTYKDFLALHGPFRDVGVRVRILEKYGLPRLRSAMRYRKMLALGAVLCVLAVMGLTQIVWDIRIIGEMDIEQRTVAAEALEHMGVHKGMLRAEADMHAIVRAVEDELGGLVYAGARMRGLTFELEIVQIADQPEMIDYGTPADIVADIGGVVESVMVLEGTAAVRPGQEIMPGDVLIEGRAVGPGGEIDVHAQGTVVLRVWVRGEGEAPLLRKVSAPTGRYENRRTLVICGIPLPVFGDAPFEECAIASRQSEIMPGLYLPAKLVMETLHEMNVTYVPRDEQEVYAEAEQSAVLAALKTLPSGITIVDKRVEFSKMKDTTLYAGVRLQVLKEAGVERRRY